MNCDVFQARLISGERPGEDAALGAHVGSCLRCFRTAADMKDVPRLAALLREGPGEGEAAYDPGARFWETFPVQVAAAWVSSRPRRRTGWWERVSVWLRRPVPAALTGAACAAGLALLLLRPDSGGPAPGGVLGGASAEGLPAELGAAVGEPSGDETVVELDVATLTRLRDQLDRALSLGQSAAVPAEEGGAGFEPGGDPANVAEDLEMLDETGLLALREKLGPRI
jgi:hypothetical protein